MYYERKAQERDPSRRCERAQRDDQLREEIARVWEDNFRVYGARKVWHQLRREGVRVARCTVEHLMRDLGITGAVGGKTKITTRSDSTSVKPPDLVNREFTATRPNQLWISGFTYVASWRGFAYTAFVIDVFARVIVGWRISSSMTTDLPLDALEQALHDRQVDKPLVHRYLAPHN